MTEDCMEHCARCSQPHENWPADDHPVNQLCTDCWEAQCSKQWWGVVIALDELGLIKPFADATTEP
jgi:hypothetical protein